MSDTVQGPEVVAPSEAARILGVSAKTIARWADEGRFGPIQVTAGGQRRLDRAAVAIRKANAEACAIEVRELEVTNRKLDGHEPDELLIDALTAQP